MAHISIISSSVRIGRNSHRVALFFKNYIETNKLATVEIIDLNIYGFPVFDERLKHLTNPSPELQEYASRIKNSDGVIIVTPEYNGGYPSSLKNAIDVLYDEWYHRPVAISTVSDGIFGGSQVITSLQFSLWKIRAWTVTAMFPVPKVQTAFDENGIPTDPDAINRRASGFLKELMWAVEASAKMKS